MWTQNVSGQVEFLNLIIYTASDFAAMIPSHFAEKKIFDKEMSCGVKIPVPIAQSVKVLGFRVRARRPGFAP